MERDKNDIKKAKSNYVSSGKSTGFLKYAGMATQMLGTILLFTYAGFKLDESQQYKVPVWTLILSLVSIAGSLYLLIRGLTKTGNRD